MEVLHKKVFVMWPRIISLLVFFIVVSNRRQFIYARRDNSLFCGLSIKNFPWIRGIGQKSPPLYSDQLPGAQVIILKWFINVNLNFWCCNFNCRTTLFLTSRMRNPHRYTGKNRPKYRYIFWSDTRVPSTIWIFYGKISIAGLRYFSRAGRKILTAEPRYS